MRASEQERGRGGGGARLDLGEDRLAVRVVERVFEEHVGVLVGAAAAVDSMTYRRVTKPANAPPSSWRDAARRAGRSLRCWSRGSYITVSPPAKR